MSKHEPSTGEPRQRARILLPSDPVRMPFHGLFEGLSIQADQDRVMGLPEHMNQIAQDLEDQANSIRLEMRKRRLEFTRSWREHERSQAERRKASDQGVDLDETVEAEIAWMEQNEAYMQALSDYTVYLQQQNARITELTRQINLRIVADTIIRIGKATPVLDKDTGDLYIDWSWPENELIPDPPDPRDREVMELFPDQVLSWMAGPALAEVRTQLQNPNSVA